MVEFIYIQYEMQQFPFNADKNFRRHEEMWHFTSNRSGTESLIYSKYMFAGTLPVGHMIIFQLHGIVLMNECKIWF